MGRLFVVCARCDRHVKPEEARCPFCDAVVAVHAEPPRAARGLSRAKLYAIHTAALAAVAVACGGDTLPLGDASTDGNASDVKATDAKADVNPFADAGADAVADSNTDDVVVQWDVIPLPYGCVFPSARGCTSVTV